MKTRATMLATAVLMVGCSGNQGTVVRREAALTDGGPKIGLIQESLFPGSTNATATPVLVLRARSITGAIATSLGARLESNMVFASADGQDVTAANVTIRNDAPGSESSGKQPERMDVGDYVFAVAAVVALRGDAWYELQWAAMTDVAISADDSYDLGVDILSRFYTGSAPQLRKLDVVNKPGAPVRSLVIQLSEPVNLKDVLSGGVVATAVAPMSSGCVIQNGDCLQVASDGATVSGFEYRFTSDVPARFELALALSLRGVAKTVREAVDEEAVRGITTINDQFVLYGMDTTSWRQRKDSHIVGWSNAE